MSSSLEKKLSRSLYTKALAVCCLIFLATCSSQPDPQAIIDKAIAVHGGGNLDEVNLSFKFRDKNYFVKREGGVYHYERISKDSLDEIRDILNNEGFVRLRGFDTVFVDEEYTKKYTSSVNSVIYFALLPFGLNDEAVVKEFLGETMIGGAPYYEIMVTFRKQGGGADFEDVFVYWIHQQNHTMDFLAYAFHTNGGGTRFRKAINPRTIEGIRFADYINYDYKGDSVSLDTYETLFSEGQLTEISRIVLEGVKVDN